MKEVKQPNIRGKGLPPVKMNLLDRALAYAMPVRAARRLMARVSMEVLNSYDGASKSRRALSAWKTLGNDADADILNDLPELRNRSRDLVRNNPLAAGAIKKKLTWVIGAGLRHRSAIDRKVLPLTDAQAEAWEARAQREWKLFWNSKNADLARTLKGSGLLRQIYQQYLENGDVLILPVRRQRSGAIYDLCLQIVEADRLENKDMQADSDTLAGGVQKDADGAPVKYHILRHHPGSIQGATREWIEYPAFGKKTGLPNVIHFFNQTRPGQSRGVPDLSAVIEPLKQLGRYTDAEIMAAVISGFFTVFIETDTGAAGFGYTNAPNEALGNGGPARDLENREIKLGNGAVVELAKGEKVHDTNPGRPNDAFDAFVLAIIRQIGVALQIPFEILISHFTASFSAARAAVNEMWKFVVSERSHIVDNVLSPIYEIWMWEAVAIGRLAAPGFFSDPLIRAAYLGAKWTGPAKGQIQELAEVKAAHERVEYGFSTMEDETAQLNGGDWEVNHAQRVKEHRMRVADGLEEPTQQTQGANNA